MAIRSKDIENTLPQLLRQRALDEIKDQGLDHAALANKLGKFPRAAKRIMEEDTWTVERGIQVLAALGMEIEVTIHPASDPETPNN